MTFNCTNCGCRNTVAEGTRVCTCAACGGVIVVPVHIQNRESIYRLASDALHAKNFDMALTYYSRILKVDATEAEANWGFLLSKYGVEVSQAPDTRNQVFFHRIEHADFTADPCWEKLRTYCPEEALWYYEGLADKIQERHLRLLEAARKTPHYDIVVACAAVPGSADALMAKHTADTLQEAGYQVYLQDPAASLSEEDKNLQEMAAAEKADAMLLILSPETDREQSRFQALWRRYFAYRRQDPDRKMLCIFRDLEPEDFPLELQSLQSIAYAGSDYAQRLTSDIGAMFGHRNREASLTRKIQKKLREGEELLEDGAWADAAEAFGEVSRLDAEEYRAYWGLIRAETKNLTQPQLTEAFDTEYLRLQQFAPEGKKQDFIENVQTLMADPMWEMLMKQTNSLSPKTRKTKDLIALIKRVRLYLSQDDPRLLKIEDYYREREYERALQDLHTVYQNGDSAKQPLFTDLQTALARVRTFNQDTEQKKTMALFTSYCAILSLVLLTAALWMFGMRNLWDMGVHGESVLILLLRVMRWGGVILVGLWLGFFIGQFTGSEGMQYLTVWPCAIGFGILTHFHGQGISLGITFLISLVAMFIQVLGDLPELFGTRKLNRDKNKAVADWYALRKKIEIAYQADVQRLSGQYGQSADRAAEFHLEEDRVIKIVAKKKIKATNHFLKTALSLVMFVFVVYLFFHGSNHYFGDPWHDIVDISIGEFHTVGLRADGTIVARGPAAPKTGEYEGGQKVYASGGVTSILREDGTFMTNDSYGCEYFLDLSNVQDLVTCNGRTAVLCRDGTVHFSKFTRVINPERFQNVVQLLAMSEDLENESNQYEQIFFALRSDHSVICSAPVEDTSWVDMVAAIEASTGNGKGQYPVARMYGKQNKLLFQLTDGSLINVGNLFYSDFKEVESWDTTDAVDFFSNYRTTAMLLKNGRVMVSSADPLIENAVSQWEDVIQIAGFDSSFYGLRSDGTVLAAGDNAEGQLDVQDWTGIQKIFADYGGCCGLREDGTVLCAGFQSDDARDYLSPRSPAGIIQAWIKMMREYQVPR